MSHRAGLRIQPSDPAGRTRPPPRTTSAHLRPSGTTVAALRSAAPRSQALYSPGHRASWLPLGGLRRASPSPTWPSTAGLFPSQISLGKGSRHTGLRTKGPGHQASLPRGGGPRAPSAQTLTCSVRQTLGSVRLVLRDWPSGSPVPPGGPAGHSAGVSGLGRARV